MRIVAVIIGCLLIIFGITALVVQNVPPARSFFNSLSDRFQLSELTQSNGIVRIVPEESVAIDVFKQVGPSVVTIAAVSPNTPGDDELYEFFGIPQPEEDEESDEREPQNIGSGFILNAEGLIVTNKHVVSDPEASYSIITSDETNFEIKQIYRDPLNDIAIIQIDPNEHSDSKLAPVTLGDSDKLQVGQLAIAIGTPLGEFSNSVTKGIVSGLGRGIVAGSPFEGFVERLDNVIQTDAAISAGNSGGPLLDSQGRVIGVNTAVSRDGENIGFALPINLVKEAIRTFETTGRFERSYLGVTYRMLSRELALQNEVPEGAIVETVIDGSPASEAGLEKGDIIISVEGEEINERGKDLAEIVAEKKVGDEIEIRLWRDNDEGGDEMEVRVRLGNATEQ